jgi:hypothetical protein
MNNIKSFDEFLFEMKSIREIVRDLARHLAFDKDVIEYLNTSRAKRKTGWRELLDDKLHGKNKEFITYITKNMVADYNPQITGYIPVEDGDDEDEMRVNGRNRRHDDIEGEIKDLEDRTEDIEDLLGVVPDKPESLDAVETALKDAGYEKPEIEDDDDDEDDDKEEE